MAKASLLALLCIVSVTAGLAFSTTPLSLRPRGRESTVQLLQLRGGVSLNPMKWFARDKVAVAPKVIISGAPASGKGTQCEFIVQKFGVVHISTGDALRDQVKKGTDLGKMAKEFMDKGALVPDEVMIGIVRDRLSAEDCQSSGWLLDGFPRTKVQAEALQKEGIVADKFVLLNVPDDVLVERCVGRRTDPATGKIYHLKFNPPPADPEVQARLVHRSDDTEEAMKKRIEQYNKNVDAIKGYYKAITCEFDGVGDKMELAQKIATFIAKKDVGQPRITPIEWNAENAGKNATAVGSSGAVEVQGSGTIVSKRAFAGDEEINAEFMIDETGRGSWVGFVRVEEGGSMPDLSLSLSAIGWGIWGGETGLIHPTYVKGRVGDQVPGFRAGQRVGLRLKGSEVKYWIDGEELCSVWEDMPVSGSAQWFVAASNGWAGTTRLRGDFVDFDQDS